MRFMSGHAHVPGLAPSVLDTPVCPVNSALLGALIGATVDRCYPCQTVFMHELLDDSASTARLVELACITIDRVFGGLPASALYDHEPGPASLEFRRLARAGLYDGAAVYRECALMTRIERREAAYTALDSLVSTINAA
ncbi:hypothetical protein KDY119_00042 [Luteimicrobium xylanilyticum]|uniref:Uncharacterized protein n=2 Tax=Luteimicrobium xylanilyticum TaxID=1133546 RepID=A0A5P9Q5B2_9MICO|nr:hypothetical protein KDY119_00042 [Luteimicrobium xylanilyticum]